MRVVNLFTSFGFFTDPADDARVISEFARVLRPGRNARVARWKVATAWMAKFLSRDWWKSRRRHDDRARGAPFDPLSGVLDDPNRVGGGHPGRARARHRIRLYTATRLAELCSRRPALVVEEAYDGFPANRPLTRPLGRDAARGTPARVAAPTGAPARLIGHYADPFVFLVAKPGLDGHDRGAKGRGSRAPPTARPWRSSTPGSIRPRR